MRRNRCPECDLPFAIEAVHIETPELVGSGRAESVYFCLESGHHVSRVAPEGSSGGGLLARLHRIVRALRRWS